jgi:hypothetical protein
MGYVHHIQPSIYFGFYEKRAIQVVQWYVYYTVLSSEHPRSTSPAARRRMPVTAFRVRTTSRLVRITIVLGGAAVTSDGIVLMSPGPWQLW